jgi:hypothetical protein
MHPLGLLPEEAKRWRHEAPLAPEQQRLFRTVNASVMPPSSGSAAAVMNPESSLARKAIAAARFLQGAKPPHRPVHQALL